MKRLKILAALFVIALLFQNCKGTVEVDTFESTGVDLSELPKICAPQIDSTTEKALFIWQDCDTGEIIFRASGGGDETGFWAYKGTIESSLGFIGQPIGTSLEDTDSAVVSGTTLTFSIGTIGPNIDQFRFLVPEGSDVVLSLSQDDGDGIFVGPDKVRVMLPFNISEVFEL